MMDSVLRVPAPAKLNLTLEVTGRLANGYHSIRSLFVRLDAVADVIELRIDHHGNGIYIRSDFPGIPLDAGNLCHLAAERYLRAIDADARVDISIAKVIPMSAGLGGGSSNAASVLLGLNQAFGNPVPLQDLSVIGSRIGKDIPFFIMKAPAAVVSGTGEVVAPLPSFPQCHFLVVNAMVPVTTRDAYQALAETVAFMSDAARSDITDTMTRAIRSSDCMAIAATLYNDFESLVEARLPIVKQLKQILRAFGAMGALMTGSGASVFGVFASSEQQRNAEQALRRHYPSFLVLKA